MSVIQLSAIGEEWGVGCREWLVARIAPDLSSAPEAPLLPCPLTPRPYSLLPAPCSLLPAP
ncbi:MAG: hypothetical protein ACRCZS_07190 [Chroococcidiopsis sp.]